jgi:hypothetical protein
VVSSEADLRKAVAQLKNGDTIQIARDLTLSQGQLHLQGLVGVTIESSPGNKFSLEGGGAQSGKKSQGCFQLVTMGITVRNLVLRNCQNQNSTFGGAFYLQGSKPNPKQPNLGVTAENLDIENCSAAQGAGFYVFESLLNYSNSSLRFNQGFPSPTSSAVFYVYRGADVHLKQLNFSNNIIDSFRIWPQYADSIDFEISQSHGYTFLTPT